MQQENPKHEAVVLFDGDCAFCNRSVSFICKRDAKDYFRFASLQSSNAKKILKSSNYTTQNDLLSSVVLIEDNVVYTKSTAALKICKKLKSPYPLLYYIFIIIPRPIRDWVYQFIAQRRHLLYGNKNHYCVVPEAGADRKFLSE